MGTLDDLYCEWYLLRETTPKDNYKEWIRNEELWLQAEKVLDPKLFEELKQSKVLLMDLKTRHQFQDGFRLGPLLMLDLQRPDAPQP